MTADVKVRRAHPGDVSAVQDVADESWHEAYDDILGSETVDAVLDEWYEDAAIEAGVENDAQDFFVAVREDDETAVLGYAHVGPHPPRRVHQLYRLYVRPDEWDQGIGKALLAEVEQALFDRDISAYEAEVFAGNDRGVAFYEATGFERVETDATELQGVTAEEHIYRKRL